MFLYLINEKLNSILNPFNLFSGFNLQFSVTVVAIEFKTYSSRYLLLLIYRLHNWKQNEISFLIY